MLNKKAIWGIAVLQLAILFSYFTNPSYARKNSCPLSETINANQTVTFYFDANGIPPSSIELQVCKQSDGYGILQYQVSNITSPHTSSKSFDRNTTYNWRLKNLSTGEVCPSSSFTIPP